MRKIFVMMELCENHSFVHDVWVKLMLSSCSSHYAYHIADIAWYHIYTHKNTSNIVFHVTDRIRHIHQAGEPPTRMRLSSSMPTIQMYTSISTYRQTRRRSGAGRVINGHTRVSTERRDRIYLRYVDRFACQIMHIDDLSPSRLCACP